jgi:hypothetical protein
LFFALQGTVALFFRWQAVRSWSPVRISHSSCGWNFFTGAYKLWAMVPQIWLMRISDFNRIKC